MFPVLLTICIITASLNGVFSQVVTSECVRAIYDVARSCTPDSGCGRDRIGPLAISMLYWEQSEMRQPSNNFIINAKLFPFSRQPSTKDVARFETCANDYQCAAQIVRNYLTRFAEDCNGDGIIDCADFGVVHFNGGCRKIENSPEFVVVMQRPNYTTPTYVARNLTKPADVKDKETDAGSSSSLVYIITGTFVVLLLVGVVLSVALAWRLGICCFAPNRDLKVSVSFDPDPLRTQTNTGADPRLQVESYCYVEPIKINQALQGASRKAITTANTSKLATTPLKQKVQNDVPHYVNVMMTGENREQAPTKEDHEYLDVLEADTANLYSNIVSGETEPPTSPAGGHPDYDYVYAWRPPLKY